MTKEELAKRKGLKVPDHTLTAAESLITSVTNEESKESKVGRPKGKATKKISFNVPVEYIDKINLSAALKYNGNTSSYLVALIEKDIAENQDVFKALQ